MLTNFTEFDKNHNKRDTNFEPIDDIRLNAIYEKAKERSKSSDVIY